MGLKSLGAEVLALQPAVLTFCNETLLPVLLMIFGVSLCCQLKRWRTFFIALFRRCCYSNRRLRPFDESRLASVFFSVAIFCHLLRGRCLAQNDEYFTQQPNVDPYFVRSGDNGTLLYCSVQAQFTQSPYVLNWVQIVGNGSPRIITTGSSNRLSEFYELDTSCSGCYNLRIKLVEYNRNNGKFYCQIQGPRALYESRPGHVVVLVVPGPPVISAQPTGPLLEGEIGRVECQSLGGNPPPTIEWYFSNGTKADFGNVRNATDLTGVTVNVLQWRVSSSENDLGLVCKVNNVARGDPSPMALATNRLIVHYKPRVTVGPLSSYDVEKGTTASLTCVAEANPPPTRFAWHLKGPLASSSWPQQNFSFLAQKESAGNYTCDVANTAGSSSASLQLAVLYAPEINIQSEVRIREGERYALRCLVDAAPPAQSIGWSRFQNVLSETDTLILANASRADSGNYTCTAKNQLNVYGVGSSPRSSSRSTTILVSHAPGKAQIAELGPVLVGSQASLVCRAEDPGIPSAEYRWKAPGMFEYEAAPREVFVISDVQLANAGEYFCFAQNEVGVGAPGRGLLVVHEPAVLDRRLQPEKQVTANDKEMSLSCSAHGQPAPNITWFKDGAYLTSDEHFNIVNDLESSTCEGSARCSAKVTGYLRWLNGVRWNDKGEYRCSAFNGAGPTVDSKMMLRVQHAPVIVNDPGRPYVAGDAGKMVSIECKTSALPMPTFRWFHGTQEITNLPQSEAHTEKNESFDVYTNVLTIRSVKEDDFGEYLCKANNLLGDSTFKFVVQKKTQPMIPSDLQPIGKSHNSILLSWTPGFNGGIEQYFLIEMVATDGKTQYFNTSDIRALTASVRSSRRWRRYVGIEKPAQVTYNLTGLIPNETYKFRVKAVNRLGETDYTPQLTVTTDDAPTDSSIGLPDSVLFNPESEELHLKWKSGMSLDVGLFCVQVYVIKSSANGWETFDCIPVAETASLRGAGATRVRIRICKKLEMICSEAMESMYGTPAAVPLEVVVPVVVIGAIICVVAVVACVCWRRRRQQFQGKNKIVRAAIRSQFTKGLKKDYETENNQARPRVISEPYMPDKTQLTSNTGGSKDSGVFTTVSSMVNYQYDAYGNEGFGSQTDGWRDSYPCFNGGNMDYLNGHCTVDNGESPYRHSGELMTNDSNLFVVNGQQYSGLSTYPDPYAVNLVDINPNGSLEGSLNSGYSTPSSNQRRVMKEIIV